MTRAPVTRRAAACTAAALLAAAAGAAPRPLAAQGRLVGARTITAGPAFEAWTFPDGVAQPTLQDAAVQVRRATQWSTPVAAFVPLSQNWTVDVSTAYMRGEVALAAPDSALGTDHYRLDGLTDVRMRVTGHVVGDNVLFTLGATLPSGRTSLDPRQLSALRVLAAPALGFQTPALGGGLAGTAGVVLARQMVGQAWALGASYEMRGKFAPITAFEAGTDAPDFNPGDAVHLSLGSDGLFGPIGMTLGLSADVYTTDRLTRGSAAPATVQLGPMLTADWRLRLATSRFRDLTLYAVNRYRSRFKRDGFSVPGSSGNYLDVGFQGLWPVTTATAVRANLDGRFHSGLDVDSTLATAATTSGALTLGVVRDVGSYSVEPFARGRIGRVNSAGAAVAARAAVLGLVVSTRF